MRLHPLILTLALATGSWPALAAFEGDDAPARLRSVEGGVALQRADEQGAEEVQANVPFLPGDRLWSDGAGRVEVQFPEGSVRVVGKSRVAKRSRACRRISRATARETRSR